MAKTLKLTFGYNGTDFTRQYSVADVPATLAAADIKTAIKGVNTSLSGGTDDGLANAFRSDDFDATNNIGKFTAITAASLTDQTVTVIDIDSEGDATNG